MSDLGTLGGPESYGFAINDQSHVVGLSDDAQGRARGFLWNNGSMSIILSPTNGEARPEDINNSDQVVGWYPTPNLNRRAFLWEQGIARDLGTLGGSESQANAIAMDGTIVGSATRVDGAYRATLYSNSQLFDLNDLLTEPLGGVLSSALGINDAGQIVATGDIDGDFYYDAYLLTPVPEPATLALVLAAVAIRAMGFAAHARPYRAMQSCTTGGHAADTMGNVAGEVAA